MRVLLVPLFGKVTGQSAHSGRTYPLLISIRRAVHRLARLADVLNFAIFFANLR
jgi:hypothetical protein